MSTDTVTDAKPVDDAIVVHDEAAEEKAHEELVSDVTKMLDKESPGETPEKPVHESEKPVHESEKPVHESEEPGDLSPELQARLKGAGIHEDLAQRLHQSGQLEETLAAFDRRMIEHVQSNKDKEPPKGEERREKEPPAKDQEVPTLDPEVYDEDLAKRDAYHQRRIDAIEAQVAELVRGQQGGFDGWFDGVLKEQGFDVSDNDKCQEVFKAYHAICEAYGTNPNARDKAMAERAYAATFPKDFFKKAQQQTVSRLRNAEGKFLSKSQSKGGPPPKGATEEEVQSQLVSDVTSYLKEQGVQMSGF